MGGPADQLVEDAQAALQRLGDAPASAEAARATLAWITEVWSARPLRVGIGGESPALRGVLLDAASGAALVTRKPGAPPVRIRRGPTTRFRVLRDGALVEERVLAVADNPAVEVARAEVVGLQHELAGIDRGIPGLVLVRPRPWAFWLWPVRWLRRRRAKGALVERERVIAALETARKRLAEVEARHIDPVGARSLFLADILAVRDATEIELELADGALPPGVELVELSGVARAEADVDAVLIATRDGVLAPVSGGTPVRVGAPDQVIGALPAFLLHARALNLARRARDRIATARTALEQVIADAEESFVARIRRLEAKRIADADVIRTQQLERMKPQVFSHIGTILEHAETHLGTELAKIDADWSALFARATANDHLKAAVAQIDTDWPVTAKRLADEVRMLVTGGVAGSAHDLYGELIAPIRAAGLPDEGKRPAPIVPPIAILPSLANPSTARWGGAGEWLAGLFKSFESKRDDIAGKAAARAAHVRTVAHSELLDAQPLLHAALTDTLAAEIDDAFARHAAHIDALLAAEYAAIDRERDALSSARRVRDEAAADIAMLAERIAALEAELPGTAAASAAARLSVGSIPWSPDAVP